MTIMDTILVVNSGSSSLKFQVFGVAGTSLPKRLVKGQLDGIGTQPRLRVKGADDSILTDQTYVPEAVGDVSAAIGVASAWLKETENLAPIAVGHRVVHGGPDYDKAVLVDDQVLEKSRALDLTRAASPATQSRADRHFAGALSEASASRLLRYGLSPGT